MSNDESICRLEEILCEMKDLLDEAKDLIRDTPNSEGQLQRAEGYWMAHIRTALDNDHSFVGGSMCTFQDTINALERLGEDEEEDEEDLCAADCGRHKREGYELCTRCLS